MRVEIVEGFSVDGAGGRTRYAPGQIVAQGNKSWVDKGLAIEATEPKQEKTEPKSAETPKG